MSKTAYIGRYQTGDGWRMQLIGYGSTHGDISDIYAEVEVPDDQSMLNLADDFLYSVATAKDLDIRARRGDGS